MIEWYAKKMESALNDISYAMGGENPYFVIFTDSAEAPDADAYKEAADNDVEVPKLVFGTFDAQPSRMAPIPGITVVSITGTLTFMPEIKRDRSVQFGSYEELSAVEGILNTFTRQENGKTYSFTDALNHEFNVSVNFSPVVCGDWQVHSTEYGETVPLSLSVYLTAVQRGVSSNEVGLFVDGYPIFYESLLTARQKTIDQFTYAKESVKSVAIQHAMMIDVVLPLQRSRICDALIKEVLDGSFTIPHIVTLKFPSYEKSYLCLLGTCNAPSKPGQNVGLSLSFAEAKEDVALEEMGPGVDSSDGLDMLGNHFAKRASFQMNGDATIGNIKDAYKEQTDAPTLEVGKRYAYALYRPPYFAKKIGSFVYDGNDSVSLGFPCVGWTYVRLTYGE